MKNTIILFLLFLGGALAINATKPATVTYVYGGCDTLTSGTITSVQKMQINFSNWTSTYRNIEIWFDVTPLSGNVSLYMLTSGNGTTWDSAKFDYFWSVQYTTGATVGATQSVVNSTDAFINIGSSFCDSTNSHDIGVLWLLNPGATTDFPIVRGSLTELTDAPSTSLHGIATLQVTAMRRSAAAIKGVAIEFSTGLISGTYEVIGIR